MTTLVLELVLTPLLIGGASLAGRRWGGALAGWLVALPLTSGPVAAFLVAGHGARFGARAAAGSLSGVPAEVAFCLGYAGLARRGWPAALVAGTLAFVAAGAAVESVPLSPRLVALLPLAATVAALLALAPTLLPRAEGALGAVSPPARWDMPARVVVTTALVVALTEAAGAVGARLTGLVSIFPLYVTVLAVFAHRHVGSAGPLPVLRGVLAGLFSFLAFFLALGTLLTRIDPVGAFAAATAAALGVQALSFAAVRPPRSPAPP